MQWLTKLNRVVFPDQDGVSPILLGLVVGVAAIFVSLVLVFLYGCSAGAAVNGVVGVLLSGACLTVGILLGFLFGIPRSLQGDASAGPRNAQANATDEDPTARIQYGANTN